MQFPSGWADIEAMPGFAPRQLLRDATSWTLLTTAYVIAGKLGLSLAVVNESASAVWPPTGIALASALLFGPRIWPVIFVGAFIVNYTTTGVVSTSLAIASGNTLEALMGAHLTTRFAGGRDAFGRSQGVLAFVLLAGFSATAISATVGVSALALAGDISGAQYGSVWLTWWLGNASGAVVVAPLLVLWSTGPQLRWTAAEWTELAVLAIALALVSWIVFLENALPIEYLTIPLCVWAGARFGSREAATVTCVLSAVAVWTTLRGLGPFGDEPPNTGLLLTQAFMIVAQMAGLGIGAAITELKEAHRRVRDANQDLERRVALRTAELQASEARLAEAQDVAHIGSWEWDTVTRQLWWSDELYRFWHVTREAFEPTYEAFLAAVHADDAPRVRAAIEGSLEDGRALEVEYRIAPQKGVDRIVLSRGRVVSDSTGRIVRMIGTAQDVTEQRQLEMRFRQAQKLEALGLLAGGIAHDFNNLITAIGGYTEIVLEDIAEGDARRADLVEIRKAAERAAGLTRRLLAFSRTQALQPRLVDINGVVAGLETLLRRTIGEHIELTLELDPRVEPVRVDPGQLEQVLLNLALNARDAMPHGGDLRFATAAAHIAESWAREHPPMTAGRYVQVTVSDTGVGMSPETQARIFEPFFTTKPPGKGTGFGLATAYGIVKQSGGFIWVSSELGRGSAFDIYLPIVPQVVATAAETRATAVVPRGTETILLVEDDGAVRRLARTVLADSGYTVLDGRDGEEALALAQRHPAAIDLVITDVVMPGLSGRELVSRLGMSRPSIRVLYTSGYTKAATLGTGIDGAAPFLPKPFLPTDLLAKVREVLSGPAAVQV